MRALLLGAIATFTVAATVGCVCNDKGCGDGFIVRVTSFQHPCLAETCAFSVCVETRCAEFEAKVDASEGAIDCGTLVDSTERAGLIASCNARYAEVAFVTDSGVLEDGPTLTVTIRSVRDRATVFSGAAKLRADASTVGNGGSYCDNPTCYGGGFATVTPDGISVQ